MKIQYIIDKNECFVCTSHKPDVHGYLWIRRENKSYHMHRYLYQLMYGMLLRNQILHHDCNNTKCINFEHLIPITQGEHVLMHTDNRGEKQGNAKLTANKVISIRKD